MFQQGDIIVHPGEGVCRVTDIRAEVFQKGDDRQYYALQPLYDASMTMYVPVDQTRISLRPILTAEEAATVTTRAAALPSVWVEDDRARRERFTAILRGGDATELVRLILDLREQQQSRQQNGKKLRTTDETALHEATRRVREELAVVHGVPLDEITL